MLPTFDNYETHGGEDVPVLAQGPWAHLFVGVHEESYFCQAIEHAAGWGFTEPEKLLSNNHGTSLTYNCNIFMVTILFSIIKCFC